MRQAKAEIFGMQLYFEAKDRELGTTVNAESTKWMMQSRSQNSPSVSRIAGVSELLARDTALNLLSQQLIFRQ
jgi:hypothetical protein